MKTTKNEAAVLNTKSAMIIITTEAKKVIAEKFNTTVEMIEVAISVKNENVLSMMRKLVATGVKEAATLA